MSMIAARDLRNHTSAVLKRANEGESITVTVHGDPVAVIGPPHATRRGALTLAEVLALTDDRTTRVADPDLRADLAWISDDTTDDLGDIR
jgi:prevent-host-death family protein